MEDAVIIQMYWDRDEGAIAATDRAYGTLCRGISRNIVGSREDAEECVNDTWHAAWTTMPPQRPNSLRAYLCRIVRNLSIDRWRRGSSRKRSEGLKVLWEELEDCVPGQPSAEEAVEERELVRLLESWLDGLGREDRVLFLRRYWFGESVKELARLGGSTPNRVSQRLFRLRGDLRKRLEQEGVML